MWERINTEIKEHCSQCPQKDKCLKSKCIVYRIKNITLAIFDSSKVNIDDFFDGEDSRQLNLFDCIGGDEI